MKIYLGDGAYAEVRDGELILTTEDGINVTNRVVLDYHTWKILKLFMEKFS